MFEMLEELLPSVLLKIEYKLKLKDRAKLDTLIHLSIWSFVTVVLFYMLQGCLQQHSGERPRSGRAGSETSSQRLDYTPAHLQHRNRNISDD